MTYYCGLDPRFDVDMEALDKLAEPRAAEHLARFAKGEPPAWPYDGRARRVRWWRKAWDVSHLHRIGQRALDAADSAGRGTDNII